MGRGVGCGRVHSLQTRGRTQSQNCGELSRNDSFQGQQRRPRTTLSGIHGARSKTRRFARAFWIGRYRASALTANRFRPTLGASMWDPDQTMIIVNPNAGGKKVARSWSELKAMLEKNLPGAQIKTTEAQGHAKNLALEAVHAGAKTIVSFG